MLSIAVMPLVGISTGGMTAPPKKVTIYYLLYDAKQHDTINTLSWPWHWQYKNKSTWLTAHRQPHARPHRSGRCIDGSTLLPRESKQLMSDLAGLLAHPIVTRPSHLWQTVTLVAWQLEGTYSSGSAQDSHLIPFWSVARQDVTLTAPNRLQRYNLFLIIPVFGVAFPV